MHLKIWRVVYVCVTWKIRMSTGKTFVIKASKIAQAIGANPYAARHDLIMECLKSYNAGAYAIWNKRGVATDRDKALKAREELGKRDKAVANELERNIAGLISGDGVSKEMLDARVRELVLNVTELSGAQKEVLVREAVSQVQTQIGTRREAAVLQDVKEKGRQDKHIVFEKHVYGRKVVCDAYTPGGDCVSVVLVGECDGLEREKTSGEVMKIIEVKNRMRRLFERVAMYERIQVLAYMSLFGAERGLLIERYGDTMREYDIEWDGGVWDEVVKGVVGFAQEVLAMEWEVMQCLYCHESCDSDCESSGSTE